MPLKSSRGFRFFELTCRWLLAVIFAWAAWPKMIEPNAFAESIYNYRILDEYYSGLIASFLPCIELATAIALITGIYSRGAALVAVGMLLIFVVGMGQAIVRHINIDCGCFGSSMKVEVSWWSIARNGFFLLLTVPTFMQPTQPFSCIPNRIRKPEPKPD